MWKAACGLVVQAELVGLTDGRDVGQREPRRVQGDSGGVGLHSEGTRAAVA